jgi:sec-independent protein translocase protein TatC
MALKWDKWKKKEKEMSFLEHLEELRWHIIRAVLAIGFMAILAFIFKNIIFDKIILAPRMPGFFTNRILCQIGEALNTSALCINTNPFNLISIRMSGQITTHIIVSLVSGVILAFPFVVWEFWRFFKPALHANERKQAGGAAFAASFLFFGGVIFGYFIIIPLSIHFLGSYVVSEVITNQINISSYIGTITKTALASGLIFELPVIAFFLTEIGLIDPPFLKNNRKYAILICFIVAAIITPPDVFSQALVVVPLLGLYEVSIVISRYVVKRKITHHDKFMENGYA